MDLTAIPKDIPSQALFYPKGSHILSDLEENHHFFILLEGMADVMYLGPGGEDMRVYRYLPVDFFGEVEMLTDHRQPLPVIAAADCRILRLSHRDVLAWMERDFTLSRHVMGRMCQKLLDGMTGKAQMRYLTQAQRYLLAMEAHARAGELPLLTKESLCQELCVPLRSLNRIIAQCADRYRFEKGRFTAAP
ncbi:MAG: cyclic nucleotide-binding domain-containing protein [Oscillospiraceae bacterium]|nr:cyclic nucleotide-binding domain-containing protein [Oscillospiraceae bacterium]